MKLPILSFILLFQLSIFIPHALASEIISPIDPANLVQYPEKKVALGRLLFQEPLFSDGNKLSCASCHFLNRATDDGKDFSLDNQSTPLAYNTPGLDYTTLNFYYTWTGKFRNIKQHLDGLVSHPKILNTTWPAIIKRLQKANYLDLFKQAEYHAVTTETIFNALLIFEKSLVKPSRFDFYLLGDSEQLTALEVKGYRLFKDYGCVACHQGKNIGGNMRQKFGVMRPYFDNSQPLLKRDLGYYNITQREEDKFFFRVPSLRNVAQTAPYFHDASAKTLKQAVKVMAKYQLGIEPSEENIEAIVAFLSTLDAIQ